MFLLVAFDTNILLANKKGEVLVPEISSVIKGAILSIRKTVNVFVFYTYRRSLELCYYVLST
jgi:hypothetical protein